MRTPPPPPTLYHFLDKPLFLRCFFALFEIVWCYMSCFAGCFAGRLALLNASCADNKVHGYRSAQ